MARQKTGSAVVQENPIVWATKDMFHQIRNNKHHQKTQAQIFLYCVYLKFYKSKIIRTSVACNIRNMQSVRTYNGINIDEIMYKFVGLTNVYLINNRYKKYCTFFYIFYKHI